jgi:flagellar motor switch/type III secretory pathway protein FliN
VNAFTYPFPREAMLAAPSTDTSAGLDDAVVTAVAVLVEGLPVQAIVTPRDRKLAATAHWLVRGDGLVIGIETPVALAEALANLRFGGAFVANGAGVTSPSVRRSGEALRRAILDAVDSVWPAAECHWQPAAGAVAGRGHALVLTVGGLAADVGLVIAEAEAQPSEAAMPRADAAWGRGMRALISATGLPLRAILHERSMPLGEAVRLKPGDVLPIDTPREVQLRIGTHRLARGTIAPQGDDGTLIVTVTNRRAAPITDHLPGEELS